MTSRAFSQNTFLDSRAISADFTFKEESSRKRRATVFDAVAGRISTEGFIPKELKYASTRDTTSTSLNAIPPEDVLFKSKNAPTRYEEFDVYFANEREARSADLPDSDLLKALHCYISDFYSRACIDGGVDDWRSFDETALIAFGILMEEASRETLGEADDLVFTEGEVLDDLEDEKSDCGSRMHSEPVGLSSKGKRVNKRRRTSESTGNG